MPSKRVAEILVMITEFAIIHLSNFWAIVVGINLPNRAVPTAVGTNGTVPTVACMVQRFPANSAWI
jgi:hypothetical protein